ncbi:amidase [Natronomonas sp. LN261]|uniref:amidase n=1 Tax=Natronomonas sp. LN261 TaxID=2750669 RepID=UPI0015EF5A7B|nr:amidase [Natronomonas sp. LN261]
MSGPLEDSAAEIAAAVRDGRRSPSDPVEVSLGRIDATDELNSFVTVVDEAARDRAEDIARGGNPGPLAGVPVAIKDLRTRKAGVPNTLGIAALADNVARTDSIGVERLEAAGAVVVGTTNTPAMAHTIKTENRLVGATPTPFDTERSAGGSSGGSAAALAAGSVRLATGSDIGGSLRVPASCCSVIGLKPTLGVVPERTAMDGFCAQTPTFVGGPMARSATETALLLDVLAGYDGRDPLSVPLSDPEYVAATERSTETLSVAYSPDLDLQPVAPAVRRVVGEAVEDLASAGVAVESADVDLPPYEELSTAYVTQVGAFFGAFAEQIEAEYGIDFGTADVADTVRSTIALADGVETVDERLRNVPRTAAYRAIESALSGHDALVTPTLSVPPYGKHLADGYPTEIDGESVLGVPTDAMLTWVFNVTGHPAASVPAGFTDTGLPVGLQVVGRRYAETDVLAVAAALERVRPWADAYPEL